MRFETPRIVANVIGALGACGQALLLFHDLADCYPYKMMSNPSGGFYGMIAYAGVMVSPTLAIGVSWRLSKRSISYTPAVTCLLCPLVFLFVFAVSHGLTGVEMDNTNNYDQTTPAAVFSEFANRALSLLLSGVMIGTLAGIGVWFGSKQIGRHQTV